MRDRENEGYDDFEQFLQNEANDETLYPSDKVWNNISNQIHAKRSWPALTFISIFIFLSFLVASYFNYPPDNILSVLNIQKINTKTSQSNLLNNKYQSSKLLTNTNTNNLTAKTTSRANTLSTSPASIHTKQDLSVFNKIRISLDSTSVNSTNQTASILVEKESVNNLALNQNEKKHNDRKQNIGLLKNTISNKNSNEADNVEKNYSTVSLFRTARINNLNGVNHPTNDKELDALQPTEQLHLLTAATTILPADKRDLLPFAPKQLPLSNLSSSLILHEADSDEDAQDNSFTKARIPIAHPWSYELYITPSNSYRKLEDDQVRNQFTTANSPSNSLNLSQKAGLGSEIGIGLRYKVSKELTIKTGVQFNIRQYYIDAYRNTGFATIKIVQNNKIDSVHVSSSFSNESGGDKEKLHNKLYQVSIPIGIDWALLNFGNWSVNASASIQPTYSLNRNVFIISTDYKNYANGESFFRNWNINSSLDFTVNCHLKNTTFYIGPQMRYQHLPTYNDKYPIKEYRLDYGIKMGIIKPF